MTTQTTPTTSTRVNNTHIPTTTEVYLHEEQIANEFGQVIQKRKTLAGTSSTLNWSDQVHLLKTSGTTPLLFGLAAGLGTLWACGRLRGVAVRRLSAVTTVSPFRASSSGRFNVKPRPGWMDWVASSWMGIQIALWSIPDEQKQEQIAELPLKAGRSGIADHLCAALVQEYQRQWKLETTTSTTTSLSRRSTLQQPRRDDLKTLFHFIDNCQKRLEVEQQVRIQRGLSALDPVAIPAPGVAHTSQQKEEKQWRDDSNAFHLTSDREERF